MPEDSARGNTRRRPRRGPPRPRRRACDSCYRKKIQCDAEFPQCNWCKHHNLACTYNRIWGQAGTSAQVALPTPRESGELMHDVDQGPPRAADPTWHLRPGNTFLNNVTYLGGHHVFSDEGRKWIESQVGESINFDKLFALEIQWLKPLQLCTDSTVPPTLRPELPSRSEVERFIVVYTLSFQSLVFPVVSRPIFAKTLDLAYSPDRPSGSASAKSCVYSFLSLISLFGFDDSMHDATDCQSYASAAQSFMAAVVGEMTIDGLQSLIMLVQIQYFLGDLQSAAVTLSIAIRLLYALRAHILPTNKTSVSSLLAYNKSDMNSHLRDLFWLCYSFDKDICLRTGQPPCMNETHCDLTLPSDYVQLQDINLQQSMPQIDEHTPPLFPWDLRLSILKSRVYQDLYSVNSLHQSVPELLSRIRSLDEALDQWRLSLPAEFRPTLYFPPETPISAKVNTQMVMLRLAYYHCVTTVHQASTKCQISGTDFTGLVPEGITSSARLSVTASCSTLSYLYKVLPVVKGECFWIILFYAITAVLTLFCNVISNPCDPDANYSVDLLQSVPGLIRSIPVRKLTLAEVIHLQYLEGFTTELAGICMRALSRTQQKATDQNASW
ncbi:C6 zinc finger domain protein [Aspergillus floccosus]